MTVRRVADEGRDVGGMWPGKVSDQRVTEGRCRDRFLPPFAEPVPGRRNRSFFSLCGPPISRTNEVTRSTVPCRIGTVSWLQTQTPGPPASSPPAASAFWEMGSTDSSMRSMPMCRMDGLCEGDICAERHIRQWTVRGCIPSGQWWWWWWRCQYWRWRRTLLNRRCRRYGHCCGIGVGTVVVKIPDELVHVVRYSTETCRDCCHEGIRQRRHGNGG